jgi:MOSC domain-containing protein YiiM
MLEIPGEGNAQLTLATLVSLQVGKIAPLGPDGVPSAIVKAGVSGRVALHHLGLTGDEQADLRVHGGPEKAVYGYPARHYEAWARDFPEHSEKFTPGGVGENFTLDGLDEESVCVGDVHAIGGALVQVCQPREPCFKFALRFADNRMVKAMVKTGRAGWYYRVLQEGDVGAGDAVTLHARPNPDFSFARLVAIVSRRDATLEECARLAAMEGLARRLQAMARRGFKNA